MKILKKLAVIILAVAMISSIAAAPVFAEQTEAALILEELGVLKGTGSGVDTSYRSSVPMRYQAAWLFLRLLGKEADAQAFTVTTNFKDAATARTAAGNPLTAENQTMLAYLYANKNLGFQGFLDDTFRPFEVINAQMYYKLMLVALGYVENTDFTWANVFEKCVEFGITETAPTNDGVFNIDKLSKATVEALRANLKGGTKALIDKLVEEEAIAADKAQESGIYTKTFASPTLSGKIENNGAMVDKDVYRLPTEVTGTATIEFDVTYLEALTEGYIGFISKESLPYFTASGAYYLTSESILVYFEGDGVKFINSSDGGPDDGGTTTWNATGAVTKDEVHHVKLVVTVAEGTYGKYDAYFDDVLIGSQMGFRSHGALIDYVDPPQTRHMVTKPSAISAIAIVDTIGGNIKVENLVITPAS